MLFLLYPRSSFLKVYTKVFMSHVTCQFLFIVSSGFAHLTCIMCIRWGALDPGSSWLWVIALSSPGGLFFPSFLSVS